MGFKWFEEGIAVPVTSEKWFTYPRVEKTQKTSRNRKTADGKEDSMSQKGSLISRIAKDAYRQSGSFQKEREQVAYASQIMTAPVISLTPETSLADAWKLIYERRFRHIPIISHEQKLIGIISDRDLLSEAAGLCKIIPHSVNEAQKQTTIQGLIKRKVLTASPDTEIRDIARIMFEEHIGSMPIIDEKGHLAGIITRSDILRTLINKAPLELWL